MTHHCTSACIDWVGTGKCHCSSCGEYFVGITAFDLHRVKDQCVSPASRGLVLNHNKFWTTENFPGEQT